VLLQHTVPHTTVAKARRRRRLGSSVDVEQR